MNMQTIDLVRKFQTAIVGVIGFLGVIMTLRSSSKLAREQSKREWEKERNVLKASLLAELRFFERTFSRERGDTERIAHGTLYIPRMRRPISQSLIANLGLLKEEQIAPVLDALLTVDEMDRSLHLHANAVNEKYFTISGDKHDSLVDMESSVLAAVRKGIAALIDEKGESRPHSAKV